ncbi:hypothetical protein ACEWY4_017666 [Coilia grayii]|uniref:Pentraxin family member n=1 Tax=Coilia grayii TaxID=363190 RepID=A0ABD1JHU5_9TELE
MAFTYGPHYHLEDDDETHVTIQMEKSVDSATMCLRYLTDSPSLVTLISMSNSESYSGVYLEKGYDGVALYVGSYRKASIGREGEKQGAWNSLCLVWDAQKGRVKLWLNSGEGTEEEVIAESLCGPNVTSPKITLGRRYTPFNFLASGGGFEREIKDIHVWDSALSSDDIQKYMDYETGSVSFSPGNIVNWKALNYEVKGRHFLLREEGKCE